MPGICMDRVLYMISWEPRLVQLNIESMQLESWLLGEFS